VSEREVEPLGEAMPWQRSAYLELFPVLRVVLLWPVSSVEAGRNEAETQTGPEMLAGQSQGWWALPYNEGDARQRLGFGGGTMMPVFLCDPTGGAERFERAVARVDGKRLWFDGPDPLADPV